MMRRAVGYLVFALLVAIGGCRGAASGDGLEAPGPQSGIDVVSYVADLRLEPETLRLGGRATLMVGHPDTLSTILLGLDEALEVRAVRVNTQPVQVRRDEDALSIPIRVGTDSSLVEIVYRGVPSTGLYSDHASGQTVVFTDSWPDRAAGWLPGVQHPSDPATLDLTLDVPAQFEVVASGRAVSDSVSGGRRSARFLLEASAPIYTFAFAVADFEVVSDSSGSVPIRYAMLAADRSLAQRLRRTPQALDTLAAMLGPYPYATYAAVQVPMEYAGMENATAAFLRADLFSAEAVGRNPVEEVNIHELVHQWWGNHVTPADWRDLWLIEGGTSYLTTETLRRLDGKDVGARHLVLVVRETPAGDARRRLLPDSYADPDDLLTQSVYNKASTVFHVLRLRVGDEAFFGTLRRLIAAAPQRPLSTDAFQRALEEQSGAPLGGIFDYWVRGTEIPTLWTRWDRKSRTASWSVDGDGGTLSAVPFELMVRQDGVDRFVKASDGFISLPGESEPTILSVGVLLHKP